MPDPIQIGPMTLDTPVALAPLAGITDLPFRQLVGSFGTGWVVSEMVASQEMVQAKPGVRERAELGFGQANTAVQLAGRDACWMAEAARMVAANGARMIDINMGCPAKKVTNGYSGSALLRDLDHALTLIDAVVAAVDIPVTLKTRLGWDEALLNAAERPPAPPLTFPARTASWSGAGRRGGLGFWRRSPPDWGRAPRRRCRRAPHSPIWWRGITPQCWGFTARCWGTARRANTLAGIWITPAHPARYAGNY